MKNPIHILCSVCFGVWASTSQAGLLAGRGIGIDFGATTPTTGLNFNPHSDVVIPNGNTESFPGTLIDTSGAAVAGVGFSVKNLTGDDTGEATVVGLQGTASGPFSNASIYADSLISNDSGTTGRLTSGDSVIDGSGDRAHFVLTFTGLNDGLRYNLIGGYDQNHANFNAIWQADGQEFTTDNDGVGFGSLSGLATDGNGNLVIHVIRESNTNGKHVTLAGLLLEATPADEALNFPMTVPQGGYSFPDAFPGVSFTDSGTWITAMESLPGHPEKLFVAVSNGRLWMIPDINSATPTKVLILDRASVDSLGYFNGTGGVAFHPNFDNNGYLYVTYPSSSGKWTRVSRFTVADPSNIGLIDNSTEQVLIEEYFHRAHGFNRLLFGSDGYLYIPVGDGKQHETEAKRPADRITQTIDEGFWSSVLRIDVDKKAGNYEPQNLTSNDANGKWTVPTTAGLAHYSIPADNPFLDQAAADGTGISTFYGKAADPTKVRTEMYAIGFRNPWKIGFVPGTSDLWVADVMNAKKERYMIVPKGGNAGWGFFSGTGDVEWLQSEPNITFPTGFQWIQPVVEYYVTDSSSGSNNKSIIGGEFYQSTAIPSLTGAFLMCDFNRGDIWAMHRPDHSDFQMVNAVSAGGSDVTLDDVGMTDSTVGGVFSFSTYNSTIELIGDETGITAMLPSPTTGEMLLADSDNKIIRKLVYTPGDIDSQLPQTLTETGAFLDIEDFVVSPEMHPYEINLGFWSDGALKKRFLNMAATTEAIQYSRDGFWQFPAGTVTMKHFDMDLDKDHPGTDVKRIETRFLVKTEADYYAITYQWNEGGTEATLVGENGVNLDLDITENGQTTTLPWRVPSRSECLQCHTDNNHVMLGLNTRQLNYEGELGDATGNFLTLLETAGYLSSMGENPANLPKHSDPAETAINIEDRVKSYLAVNCSYCHFSGNRLVPDSWSGEPHLSIEATKLLHGEAIGFNVIDEADRLVIPGDAANSIILSRASASNGYSRMPPLASNVIDLEGVALLQEWIENYANAKPVLDATAGPFSVAENSPASTPVGDGPLVLDADAPRADRGTLSYSIIDGNDGEYFAIDPATGAISLTGNNLDYEEITSRNLTIRVSDGFAPNPGELTTQVSILITDILNDDSQGDGIEDGWAVTHFGQSSIDRTGDFDLDGTPELLEYWAKTDPKNASESFSISGIPAGRITTEGADGYYFEWVIRTGLTVGSDYKIQGAEDLAEGFLTLDSGEEFSVESVDALPEDPILSRVRIKVNTPSEKYFIRITSP
ncbi:MAG: PQQ-dependent sugar dehydrogenase [Luteolibacter sp.]